MILLHFCLKNFPSLPSIYKKHRKGRWCQPTFPALSLTTSTTHTSALTPDTSQIEIRFLTHHVCHSVPLMFPLPGKILGTLQGPVQMSLFLGSLPKPSETIKFPQSTETLIILSGEAVFAPCINKPLGFGDLQG